MKSVTTIERDDYLIISNPDLVNDYKFNLTNYTIGSGERALYFGELQVYNTLRVEGELNILQGSVYNYILNESITSNQTLYGQITVDGTIDIGAELTIV
jgi:hypothetical protein